MLYIYIYIYIARAPRPQNIPQNSNPPFGVYETRKENRIPLKDIKFNIKVISTLMELKITQEYKNESTEDIECEYIFPIGSKMSINKLSITSENSRIIEAEIIEKEAGNIKYSDSITRGYNTFQLTYKEGTRDLAILKLGKLGAGEAISVEIGIVQQIDIRGDNFCIRIPTTYTPTCNIYNNHIIPTNEDTFVGEGEIGYGWRLEVEISTPGALSHVWSNYGEEFHIKYEDSGRKARGCVSSKQIPDSDILVEYAYVGMENPSLVIQYSEKLGEYAAMFSYCPKFKELESRRSSRESPDMESKGEYIFLLDCSGSMSGSRIQMARESCALFIRSLPFHSTFNIIFFGSKFHPLFPHSLKYSQSNIQKALKILENKEADMGGTDILSPLKYIYNLKGDMCFPRNIYMLTDGDVGEREVVIAEIRKHSHHTRVHTFGIGNGAGDELVRGAAEAGRGMHQFVTDTEDLAPRVISSLSKGCKPTLSHPKLEWPVTSLITQYPPRDQMESIYLDEIFFAFAIYTQIPDILFNIKFSAIDSRYGHRNNISLEFNKDMCLVEGEGLFQIIGKKLLDSDRYLHNNNIEERINISLKYFVVCDETTLIGIDKSNAHNSVEGDVKARTIPIYISKDYKNRESTYTNTGGGLMHRVGSRAYSGHSCGAPVPVPATTKLLKGKRIRPPRGACCAGNSRPNNTNININTYNIGEHKTQGGVRDEGYKGVIKYQMWNGGWEMSTWVEAYYDIQYSLIRSYIPPTLENIRLSTIDSINTFATVLALKILEDKYAQDKDSWCLVYIKGVKYLETIHVHQGVLHQIINEIHIPQV